jgi:hypothetical protein
MNSSAAPSVTPTPRKGFTPFPNEYCLEWPRLISGNAQIFSVMYINTEIHVPRDKGAPVPHWSRPITDEELATVCRCTVRAIEIAIKDLVERSVVQKKRVGRGWAYHIAFEKWPSLPDIPPSKPPVALPDPNPAPEETEDEAKAAASISDVEVILVERVSLRPGRRTKPMKFKTAPDAIQVDTNISAELSITEKAGVARITLVSKQEQTKSEEMRKSFRQPATQAIEKTQTTNLKPLHELLDDYCRRHHGTIPNDKLLTKVCQSMGHATFADFKTVFQARIRTGNPISMGLLINLAEDARLAAETRKPEPSPPTVANTIPESKRAAHDEFLRLTPEERARKLRDMR